MNLSEDQVQNKWIVEGLSRIENLQTEKDQKIIVKFADI